MFLYKKLNLLLLFSALTINYNFLLCMEQDKVSYRSFRAIGQTGAQDKEAIESIAYTPNGKSDSVVTYISGRGGLSDIANRQVDADFLPVKARIVYNEYYCRVLRYYNDSDEEYAPLMEQSRNYRKSFTYTGGADVISEAKKGTFCTLQGANRNFKLRDSYVEGCFISPRIYTYPKEILLYNENGTIKSYKSTNQHKAIVGVSWTLGLGLVGGAAYLLKNHLS